MHSVCLVCATWCFLGVACVPHGRTLGVSCVPPWPKLLRTCMVPPPGLIIHDPLRIHAFFLNEFAYVRTYST